VVPSFWQATGCSVFLRDSAASRWCRRVVDATTIRDVVFSVVFGRSLLTMTFNLPEGADRGLLTAIKAV
jgi:hypothetical protein